MEKTVSIICALLLFLPIVQGLDFSVSPSVISVEHIKPGMILEKTIIITPDDLTTYSLELQLDDQLKEYVTIQTKEQSKIVEAMIMIHIPSDTPPQLISGKLLCQLKPKQNPGIRASIELPVHIILDVNNEYFEEYELKLLRVEQDELVFVIDNSGNEDHLIEHIDLVIYDNNKENILQEKSLQVSILTKAFSEQEHRVSLPLLPTGQYWASINIQGDTENIIFDYQQEEKTTELNIKEEKQKSNHTIFSIISLLILANLSVLLIIKKGLK